MGLLSTVCTPRASQLSTEPFLQTVNLPKSLHILQTKGQTHSDQEQNVSQHFNLNNKAPASILVRESYLSPIAKSPVWFVNPYVRTELFSMVALLLVTNQW